jgi:DNA-binding NarL/FixJ family response regulator
MISVIIADDHRLVAEGIEKLIDGSNTAKVVGIADNISDAALLVAEKQPDILLLDVAMPDGDGIDAIAKLKNTNCGLKVIVLTVYAEPSVIRRAIEGGADGYILKNTGSKELIEGIMTVAGGEQFVCREARWLLMGSEAAPSLTAREREVLRLIVEGNTMKQIAHRLNLGFETVHSYTKTMRQKLGCPNMSSLVRTAIERHLI